MTTPASLNLDMYKTSHVAQYPEGTTLVYSNYTCRGSRIEGVDKTIFFGLQYYIKKYLIEDWNKTFFNRPANEAVQEYIDLIGDCCPLSDYSHMYELHDLGYLPVEIKAVSEGTSVPIRVPSMTIHNTLPEFYWVTNMLETSISMILWGGINSATIANQFRKKFEQYAELTCDDNSFVPFQSQDFSMRGMFGLEAAAISGSAHLTSFFGTDTIPAVVHLNKYYHGEDSPIVGCSVAATEHSVQTANAIEGDNIDDSIYISRMLDIYPNGIVSIVSDGFDFWNVITNIIPSMKDRIMARDGKVVIRPDSGDPVDIICGEYIPTGSHITDNHHKDKGLIQCLWDTFGGAINSKGYKVLDSHIGAIYGDAISLDRQDQILARLEAKGFASSNIVLGIGSFTYQYNTRDTFGGAIKATYVEINGVGKPIFKSPKTGTGLKNSMKGLLKVNSDFSVDEDVTWDEEHESILETVFKDGKLTKSQSLEEIRLVISNTNESILELEKVEV